MCALSIGQAQGKSGPSRAEDVVDVDVDAVGLHSQSAPLKQPSMSLAGSVFLSCVDTVAKQPTSARRLPHRQKQNLRTVASLRKSRHCLVTLTLGF